MRIQKAYDKRYKGRRLIVMQHSFKEDLPEEYKDYFSGWYCGYMEVLAADKDYAEIDSNDNPADESCVEELYPNAIGGLPGLDIYLKKVLMTITIMLVLILTTFSVKKRR